MGSLGAPPPEKERVHRPAEESYEERDKFGFDPIDSEEEEEEINSGVKPPGSEECHHDKER